MFRGEDRAGQAERVQDEQDLEADHRFGAFFLSWSGRIQTWTADGELDQDLGRVADNLTVAGLNVGWRATRPRRSGRRLEGTNICDSNLRYLR